MLLRENARISAHINRLEFHLNGVGCTTKAALRARSLSDRNITVKKDDKLRTS